MYAQGISSSFILRMKKYKIKKEHSKNECSKQFTVQYFNRLCLLPMALLVLFTTSTWAGIITAYFGLYPYRLLFYR